MSKTDRNGTTFTYDYDRLGRVLSETAVNGATTEQRTYAYSISGALISESNGAVTITRKYDVLGRLIEETETSTGNTAVSRYAYTKRDERERYAMTLNGEEIISEYYEYDDLGRLWKVYDSVEMWGINDGVYVPVYDFSSFSEYPIYRIGMDGMRYRLVPVDEVTADFSLTYTVNNITYGVCFEDDFTMVGAVGSGSSVIEFYYEGVLDTVYNITFNGGLTTLLYWYYIYDENDAIVYSVAITAEDFSSEVLTLEIMVFDGEFDFGPYMTAYSLRSVDSTETLVATYTYDANGNRTSLTYANGTTKTYEYDGQGNRLRKNKSIYRMPKIRYNRKKEEK
ncbi:MAG: RHS repeat protein [Clostridia bacterium]|nr:RHS repeat protein [Clostridia bacterium]